MLTDTRVRTLPDGKYGDGHNLYLTVRGNSRLWMFRYVAPNGSRREMQLGSHPVMGIMAARAAALRAKQTLSEGKDPLEARIVEIKAISLVQERQSATLESVCREYHAAHVHTWRNDKHATQWISSLENHVLPTLGNRAVHTITTADLLGLLLPLNPKNHETTKRLRQRLEVVFAGAKLRGLCDSNPAMDLRHALKSPAERRHFASLPYEEIPQFIKSLRDFGAAPSVRLGLEFLILAAARTGEVLGVTHSEINLSERTWIIPAVRMKAQQDHRVPLTDRMIEIVNTMKAQRESIYLFPGQAARKPLSNMAFAELLRRIGIAERATVHGFRSSFSTWANQHTRFKSEIIEAALAHQEKNAVRAAYNHAEYWQQRVKLAEAWGNFCIGATAATKVVKIRA